MRKLKFFSYRSQFGKYDNHTLYIAATSRKQVVELLEKIGMNMTVGYIKDYFLSWGTSSGLNEAEITVPSVYITDGTGYKTPTKKPKRIV